jgi:hypothetical protein
VDDNLVSCALDETGMVDTSLLCNNCENNEKLALVEQQEGNGVMELGILEEVLQVHGIAPASKLEGAIWLIYKNVNGICNKLSNMLGWKRPRKFITNWKSIYLPTTSIG